MMPLFNKDMKPAEDTDVADPCIICHVKIRNVLFLHGKTKHLASCTECAEQWITKKKTCPVCMEPVERVVKTFVYEIIEHQ